MTDRLRVGARVRMDDGREYRVDLVNDSRARLVPVAGRHAVIRARDGREVEFDAPGRPISVAPNAELEVVEPGRAARVPTLRLPRVRAEEIEVPAPCAPPDQPTERGAATDEAGHGPAEGAQMATHPKMSKAKMAAKPKAAPKQVVARAAREPDGLCTFAVRLPEAERDAIHRAAGPGGATRWVRRVLAEAAAK